MENNSEDSQGQKKPAHGSMWTVSVVVLVVALGAIVFFNKDSAQLKQQAAGMVEKQDAVIGSVSGETKPSSEEKVFNIVGNNFSFSPAEIRVKRGDTVKIVFNNKVGFHDLVIDEYSVRTPQIQADKSAEIIFTADKTGTFEYYCSVGQHRAMGMKGNLIVE
ncbi:MAG: cupredoxin domain-containing protein [Candidatus Doudnabacteria bacterium]|nr:cupredoxin domain-containing protein [Candidatus Doudnabacteria bacterium]